MKLFVAASLLFWSLAAIASTPTGSRHGKWHVSSITSLSGDGADDPSAGMVQTAGHLSFAVNWATGPVSVELSVSGCDGIDNEPEFNYNVELTRWLAVPEADLARQIARDMAAAEGQARLICPDLPFGERLSTQGLRPALRDLNLRLRALSNVGGKD